MNHPGEVVVAVLPRARGRIAADLISLTKPRVVLMVLITDGRRTPLTKPLPNPGASCS